MIVIGLTGFAEAGKSTVAEHLVQAHGFTRLSFAAPLKQMLRTLDPVLVDTPNHYAPLNTFRLSEALKFFGSEAALKKSRYGPEYRRLLQVLGTDCIRAADERFWVRAALAQMTNQLGRYVFDDCRFPNEAAAIRMVDNIWNIIRPGQERGEHESEQHAGRMGETVTIVNDSNVRTLQKRVDIAVNAYVL